MPPLPHRQTTMVSRCPFGLDRRHLLAAVELAMETELWSDRFCTTASGVAAMTACGACAAPAAWAKFWHWTVQVISISKNLFQFKFQEIHLNF
jgi:hypothetical protein